MSSCILGFFLCGENDIDSLPRKFPQTSDLCSLEFCRLVNSFLQDCFDLDEVLLLAFETSRVDRDGAFVIFHSKSTVMTRCGCLCHPVFIAACTSCRFFFSAVAYVSLPAVSF